MRVAIIHDWLNGMRGGEKVLEAILELYPQAEIYTLFCEKDKISETILKHPIQVSFLGKFKFFRKHYRFFFPIFPFLIRRFKLKGYDLILSSSHCVAKGIRKPKSSKHLSYVHAPMRYMWDRFDDYFKFPSLQWLVATLIRPLMQIWDKKVSQRENIDLLIANSRFIQSQIQSYYQRGSQVIYPFVDLDTFHSIDRQEKGYYLCFGAFAPYKRFDIAIKAFECLGLKLIVAGSGQNQSHWKSLTNADNIQWIDQPSFEQVLRLYQGAKAFIFPAKEDFGITPLEAMAIGVPVIAYAEGGAFETVTSKTGIFFSKQTAESLSEAVLQFEKTSLMYKSEDCKKRAQEFSKARFQTEFNEQVELLLSV